MDTALIGGSAAVSGSLLVLWWAFSGGEQRDGAGLAGIDPNEDDLRSVLLREAGTERVVAPQFQRMGARLRKALPSARIAALERKIARAGSPIGWTVERVLAAKALLIVVLGALATTRFVSDRSSLNFSLVLVAVLFGYFLPEGLLDSKVGRRQDLMRAEIADTIDQLAVMVRAGLGIDAAILRTARSGTGPIGEEFTRVVQDMRVGMNRSAALANMSERVDIPELRGFVAALSQAERLGVPVSETLQVQSAEMRVKRRQLAEESAMKLPVKILFPMVFCILPVLFIVLLGPAGIKMADLFK